MTEESGLAARYLEKAPPRRSPLIDRLKESVKEAGPSSHPIRRETHIAHDDAEPRVGVVLRSTGDVQLKLERALGEGAFSSVWLARDMHGSLGGPSHRHATTEKMPSRERGRGLGMGVRRKSESIAKRRSDRKMHGIRPTPPAALNLGFDWRDEPGALGSVGDAEDVSSVDGHSHEGSLVLDELDGEGACPPPPPPIVEDVVEDEEDGEEEGRSRGRLVAVKMMNRALCDANDRTRISFVREVEVLRVSFYRISVLTRSVSLAFGCLPAFSTAHLALVHRLLSPLVHHADPSLPRTRVCVRRGAL